MAILKVANRYFEFDEISGFVETTASGTYDSAFVSNGLRSFVTGVDPNSYMTLITPAGASNYWLHFRGYATANGSDGNSGTPWVQLLNASNVVVAEIFKDNNVTQTSRLRVKGTPDVTSTGTITPNVNTAFFLDIHVTVSGATTTVNVYFNGSLAMTATQTANGSRGMPVKATMRAGNCGYTGFNRMNFSEFILADTSTVGMRLHELQVNTAGFYSDFIGTVTDLNTENITGLVTDSAGERSSWNPVAYAGSGAIAAVVSSARSHRKSGAPSKLAHFLRMSSTNYDGTDQTITELTAFQQIWETNPATTVAWVEGDLTGIQVGLKSAT